MRARVATGVEFMKLLKLIANLGYGSRKQVAQLFREGRIRSRDGRALAETDAVDPAQVVIDGEPMDPPPGLLVMLHKPTGYTCSTKDSGRLIYELLPERFRLRDPLLSYVGRLDRETSGLLLLTDDGALLHRIVRPKSKLPKVYEVSLARDLVGDEGEHFSGGELMLESETEPLAPAQLDVLGPRHARLTITEGRYHQVRRMFAALGNHVETLHRSAVGRLELGVLPAGHWRVLDAADRALLFA